MKLPSRNPLPIQNSKLNEKRPVKDMIVKAFVEFGHETSCTNSSSQTEFKTEMKKRPVKDMIVKAFVECEHETSCTKSSSHTEFKTEMNKRTC